jgi:hypothetical protein
MHAHKSDSQFMKNSAPSLAHDSISGTLSMGKRNTKEMVAHYKLDLH